MSGCPSKKIGSSPHAIIVWSGSSNFFSSACRRETTSSTDRHPGQCTPSGSVRSTNPMYVPFHTLPVPAWLCASTNPGSRTASAYLSSTTARG